MPLSKGDITRLRSLQEKKHREELGLFAVEGTKVVGELLKADFPFVAVYATPAWAPPDQSGQLPALVPVTPEEMERISHYPTPSPVFAVARVERRLLPPAQLNRGRTLALDGIQDPGNVGTLLRIADWYGFDRVLLSPDCADLFSPKVIGSSMGSFARVAAVTVPLHETLAQATIPVLGCDLTGDSVHSLTPLRDVIVVIGSEGRGISPAVATRLTRRVTIPKFGGAESLNAAVAAAIVCDNLRRNAPRE